MGTNGIISASKLSTEHSRATLSETRRGNTHINLSSSLFASQRTNSYRQWNMTKISKIREGKEAAFQQQDRTQTKVSGLNIQTINWSSVHMYTSFWQVQRQLQDGAERSSAVGFGFVKLTDQSAMWRETLSWLQYQKHLKLRGREIWSISE